MNTERDYVRGQGGEQMAEEAMDANGNMAWQHTNVWANGTLIGTYDSNGLHFYLNDWLGTRRVQTDYEGVTEQTCSSLPYGNGETCTPFPTENLFTGKERDTESGNDYFGARYFGSSMGRFLSPDPIIMNELRMINPQRWNKYAYAVNNPLVYDDPTGKDAAYVAFADKVNGLGHAGVLSIHKDGTATYSEFGPQGSAKPVGPGEVRTDTNLPTVQFNANGTPTPASIGALIDAVAKFDNDDPSNVGLDYFKTSDAEASALDEYIKQRQEASNRGNAPRYCFWGSSCKDYAVAGLRAAGVGRGFTYSPVPMTAFFQFQSPSFMDPNFEFHVDPEAGHKKRQGPPCLRDRNSGQCVSY